MESSVIIVTRQVLIAPLQLPTLSGEGGQLWWGCSQAVGGYGTQNDAPQYACCVIIVLQSIHMLLSIF